MGVVVDNSFGSLFQVYFIVHLLPSWQHDSSIIFISVRSCGDIFAASHVQGDTDTPIDSVVQNSLKSAGGANLTWRTCFTSGGERLDFPPNITHLNGLLRAARPFLTLVSPA
jgi:hypothetical protein